TLRGLAQGLLAARLVAARAQAPVVLARLVLPLLLDARRDRRPQVLGAVAPRVDEVLRVRAQTVHEPVEVARHGPGALRREAPVEQVPREVALHEAQAEQVAQRGEHLARPRVLDRLERLRERLPAQQL